MILSQRQTMLSKDTYQIVKDALLKSETYPFTPQNVTFCNRKYNGPDCFLLSSFVPKLINECKDSAFTPYGFMYPPF